MIRISKSTLTRLVPAVAVVCMAAMGANAAVPKKQPLGRYSELWTKSPFTVPPVVEGVEVPEENPLEDYTLAGVCEIKEGWFVVLMNKKERDKRIRIKPGEKNTEGFKVSKVESGSKYLEARVEIQTPSGKTGWVEYDEKFIALKKPTVRAPQNNNAAQQRGRPPVPGRPAQPQRATRPPIPQPNARGNANTTNRPTPTRVRRRTVPAPPSR